MENKQKMTLTQTLVKLKLSSEENDRRNRESLQTYKKALSQCKELKNLINENCGYPLDSSLIGAMVDLLGVIERRLDFAVGWLTDDIEHNAEYIKSLENDIEKEEEKQ